MVKMKLREETHRSLVERVLNEEGYALSVRKESEGLTVEAASDRAVQERLGSDPVFFSALILGHRHSRYQRELLATTSKRVVVRWPRQCGKSLCFAVYSIWFAATHPGTTSLIVAPCWRQSGNLHSTIQSLLDQTPRRIRRGILKRRTKTITEFRNGARIIALPNSAGLIRCYTANLILLDEAAFFKNDEEIFLNILPPMLATTGGAMFVASTPWGKNTQFYRINNDPEWKVLHVTWREPVEEGIYAPGWETEIERVREAFPLIYRMEYEAEFTEDVDAWLTQDILAKSCTYNVEYMDFQHETSGDLYAGLDLAEVNDYSALAVLKRRGSQLDLIHMKRFPHGEELASVMGYVNVLGQRWPGLRTVYVDNTKHGRYIIEDMKRAGVRNPVGVNFSVETKQEMAQILRDRLAGGKLRIPYDRNLINELNVERYQLTKTGRIAFSHMSGTHDDRFWALALAAYAATKEALPQRPIARV
jgi:phage FluMu gp28-like protein